MTVKATRIRRRELYDMVWHEPMKSLSARFGISDVGLRKICVRAEIPIPPRGYCAMLKAGKTCRKPPFPGRSWGMDDEVLIGSSQYSWPRWTDEELLGPIPSPPQFDEPIEAVRESARRALGKVTVTKDLSNRIQPSSAFYRTTSGDVKRCAINGMSLSGTSHGSKARWIAVASESSTGCSSLSPGSAHGRGSEFETLWRSGCRLTASR